MADYNFELPNVVIERPLLAVVGMAQNGNEKDVQAKQMDYQNTLLTLNKLRKFECALQLLRSSDAVENDEKKEIDMEKSSESSFTHVSKAWDEDMITKEAKYKVSWSKAELVSFCKEVASLLEDEAHEYDSLIFVLTAHTKKDHFGHFHAKIMDSYGTLINLKFIMKFFDKNHLKVKKDAKEFPIIFMIDRYFEMNDEELEEELEEMSLAVHTDDQVPLKQLIRFVNKTDDVFLFPEMDERGNFSQFYSHRKPLAILDGKRGGMMTQVIKNFFSVPPQIKQYSIDTVFSRCGNKLFGTGYRLYPAHCCAKRLEVTLGSKIWQ